MKKIVSLISIIISICLILGGCSAVDRISSGAYTEGDTEITDEIYKIDIEWPAGSVMVRGSTVAKGIIIKESGSEVKLASRVIGSVLYIKPAMPGKEAVEKSLTVIVPPDYNYREIEIRTDSASAGLRFLKTSRADIETVSGSISVISCEIDDEAELESKTGNITAGGGIVDYDLQTVSGGIEITTDTVPEDLDAETVKGFIVANLPGDIPSGSFRIKTKGQVTNKLTNKEKGNDYVFKSETGVIYILENLNSK